MADKILVVDDESTTREVLNSFLTSEGYEVILASSGVEAFQLAISESPDAILLDWKMPGIDGLEVCRRLRADEKTTYIPIIIISGFGTTHEKATDAGADDLIDKPFGLTTLAIRLKSVLRIGHITDPAERMMTYMSELDKNRQKYLHERGKMVILELRVQSLVLKEYTLRKGDSLTIGRHPDNDIVPKDAAVSNYHAIIERKGEKLIVLDKASKNGTFVNEKKVQSSELNNEDIVKIGNQLHFKVHTISLKKGEPIITKEHDDESAVITTIEKTLHKL